MCRIFKRGWGTLMFSDSPNHATYRWANSKGCVNWTVHFLDGFKDTLNEILIEWLQCTNKLYGIYNPLVEKIPNCFLHTQLPYIITLNIQKESKFLTRDLVALHQYQFYMGQAKCKWKFYCHLTLHVLLLIHTKSGGVAPEVQSVFKCCEESL